MRVSPYLTGQRINLITAVADHRLASQPGQRISSGQRCWRTSAKQLASSSKAERLTRPETAMMAEPSYTSAVGDSIRCGRHEAFPPRPYSPSRNPRRACTVRRQSLAGSLDERMSTSFRRGFDQSTVLREKVAMTDTKWNTTTPVEAGFGPDLDENFEIARQAGALPNLHGVIAARAAGYSSSGISQAPMRGAVHWALYGSGPRHCMICAPCRRALSGCCMAFPSRQAACPSQRRIYSRSFWNIPIFLSILRVNP